MPKVLDGVASHHEPGVLRGETFVSQEELFARSRRAASGLQSLGVGVGHAVALLMRNDHEFFEATLAAGALGAAVVPINWHGSAEEVAYIVSDSQARVLVAHADLLARVHHALPSGVTVLGVTTPSGIAERYGVAVEAAALADDVTAWSQWRDDFAPLPEAYGGEPITMLYTSGTTGHPKGVRRIPGSQDAEDSAQYLADVFRYGGIWPGMRTVIAGPMYHSAPFTYATMAARLFDAFVVLEDRFDAEELLALIERHAITSLYLVPTMFIRLLRLPKEVRERYDLSSLRAITQTAAPCPPDVKRGLIEWLGPIVNELYGSTEVGYVTGCDSEEWLAHPGTVGRPLATCSVEIIGEDGPMPTGGIGEAFVRARGLSDFTYHGRHEARVEIEREGLITCGDVGFLDEDGFLYLCDRVRDMVISGGVNIYPIEIEACLLKLPGIADCAVFGIPDDEYGEAVAAAIKLDPGASIDAEAIRSHVRRHLAGFKAPKVVEFLDDLPREDSGKLFKRKLRDPYWEGAGRTI